MKGRVTKDDFETTLRSWKHSKDETWSVKKEKAAAMILAGERL